jgi:hypothetical protein
MKHTRQTTLDGSIYTECDRLGVRIERETYDDPLDYRLLVTGSRGITDRVWIFSQLDAFVETHHNGRFPRLLIHGNAKGVDQISGDWGASHDIPIRVVDARPYLQQWPPNRYRFQGYKFRDYDMVDHADEVIGLWDGKSSGTKLTMDYARSKGKLAACVVYEK